MIAHLKESSAPSFLFLPLSQLSYCTLEWTPLEGVEHSDEAWTNSTEAV